MPAVKPTAPPPRSTTFASAMEKNILSRYRVDLFDSLTRFGTLVIAANVVAAFVAYLLIWHLFDSWAVFAWAGVVAIALISRISIYVAWRKSDSEERQMSPRWERSLALSALLEGVAWGTLACLVPLGDPASTFAIAAVVTTVAFAGLSAFGLSILAGPYFLVPIFLGQAFAFAFSDAPFAKALMLLWILIAVLALAANVISANHYRRTVFERLRQETVAAEQRTLLDTLTVGVLVTQAGIITDCNERLLTMLGYERGELINAPALALALSDKHHSLSETHARALVTGNGTGSRIQQRRKKTGGALWVEVNAGLVDPEDKNSPMVTVLEDITERLATERELDSSRERLRLALDALQSGVWDVDLLDQRFFFSRRFCALLGLPSKEDGHELPRRLFFHHDLIAVEDRGLVDDERYATLVKGEPFDVQYRIKVAGEVRWLRETAIVVLNDKGQPTRFTGSVTDTTAMNQIQQKLLESEVFHRGLVDASNTCIWSCDPAGIVTFVNDRGAQELYDYEPHEMIGRHIYEFMPPESLLPEARALFDPVLRGENVRNVEMVHMTSSQRRVFVSINAVALYDAEGKFNGVMGVNTDITHVKRRERAFQDATRLQRLIFDAAGEGIVLMRNRRIYRCNQAFADLIGYTLGDLVTRPLSKFFEDPGQWDDVEDKLMQHREVIKVEQRILHSSGNPIWASITGRSTEVDDLGLLFIWVFTDISATKAQEEQSWYSANHDELTGLPNRRLLQDRFEQSLARARRESARIALLMLDLDGFKAINDHFGHQIGDQVLKQVAARLAQHVRQLDTVARLGGDEFVIVLHQYSGLGDLEMMAGRLIEQIAMPMEFDGKILRVSTSIGIALYPDTADGVVGLMHAADIAMYSAKGAGKNTFKIAAAVARPSAPVAASRPIIPPV
jgi:diguanylate cyclase (GGDEF)-like protein/PAS domain S-box-containing protein